jgi:acyl carrier protein
MELVNDPMLLAEITRTLRQAAKLPSTTMIAAGSRLVEDLGIDSLDLVNVLLKIQDCFDIAIDDEDVPNLRLVSDLARYVQEHRGSAVA